MINIINSHKLTVSEICIADISSQHFLSASIELLSDNVVRYLPVHFQNINSAEKALSWYQTLLADAQLFAIHKRHNQQIMGYIFAYEDTDNTANLGYLMGDQFQGNGYAKEALNGFIRWAKNNRQWHQLRACVAPENTGSMALLQTLGFEIMQQHPSESLCYQRTLR